jgi:hypothetical protein
MNRVLQFVVLVAVIAQFAIGLPVFLEPPGHDVDNPAVKASALPPVILWFLAMAGRLPRLSWIAGCGLFLVHVAVAFHAAHGWSHWDAIAHVERSSGVGEGLFASYAFALIWLFDASWWLAAPSSYSWRKLWWSIIIDGYLAFVVFNATVVFGHGVARWLGIAIFVVLAVAKTNAAGRSPPRRE